MPARGTPRPVLIALSDDRVFIPVGMLLAVLVGAIGGLVGEAFPTGLLVAIVGGIALLLAVTRSWGSAAVALPAFLVSSVPARSGLSGGMQIGLVTLVLAIAYWSFGAGRPRIRPSIVLAPVILAAAAVLLAAGHHHDLQAAIWPGLMWISGTILGGCLFSERAAVAFVAMLVPLALLAIAEIAGVHNPWLSIVHTDNADLSLRLYGQRAQSTFGHPLIAGDVFAIGAALAMSLNSRWRLLIAPCLAGAALATVSRSAILALLAALAVLLVTSGRSLPRVVLQAALVALVGAVLVTQVPQLQTSVVNRFTGARYQTQTVRTFAIDQLRTDWQDHPESLLLGGGIGETTERLGAIGGVDGFTILDNQYVTFIYDVGFIPLALVFAIVAIAARRARGGRGVAVHALAALAATLVGLAFTDGLYWGSLGLMAWIAVGLLGARPRIRTQRSPAEPPPAPRP